MAQHSTVRNMLLVVKTNIITNVMTGTVQTTSSSSHFLIQLGPAAGCSNVNSKLLVPGPGAEAMAVAQPPSSSFSLLQH